MNQPVDDSTAGLSRSLAEQGYWPARAAQLLAEQKYSAVVELCKRSLIAEPKMISGRLIYGRALYAAGQHESAAEQFYYVLSLDPDNAAALKYLGDIRFAEGDELAAAANYARVLEIDPQSTGLKCELRPAGRETTRTITLTRPPEGERSRPRPKREIPFYTETIGDLYMRQGHADLAVEVFELLAERNRNPRLVEKLTQAREQLKTKGR